MNEKAKTILCLVAIMGLLIILTNSCKKKDNTPSTPIVTDIDGNVYHIVTIGTQEWMVENLKTTRYNDGSSIPLVTENASWDSLGTPKFCWFDNDISNKNIYGALYNWYAVNTGKLAPKGWHVPTYENWQTLLDFLIANGYNYDGSTSGNKIGKAMAANTNWDSTAQIGSIGNTDYPSYRNKSGFTALPAGYRDIVVQFGGIGKYGYWWSSSEYDINLSRLKWLTCYGIELRNGVGEKSSYNSVRCVRD